MQNVYIIMFAVGVLYTLVSFIISGVSGALHLGSSINNVEGHIGGHGHGAGHSGDLAGHNADAGHHTVGGADTILSWFSILINPIVAVSFLTVFGGLGLLGSYYFKWVTILVLLVSLAAGISVSAILYKFVAKPLYNSENSTDVSREELVSTQAEVISNILENGFGQISYTVNSIRYTAPARHLDGKSVKQGEKVIICKIENGVFYVSHMPVI